MAGANRHLLKSLVLDLLDVFLGAIQPAAVAVA
jgi:hypothetical protein